MNTKSLSSQQIRRWFISSRAAGIRFKFWNGRLYAAVPVRLVAAPRRRALARPPVIRRTASTPRPREHRALPRGRDGGERDDGSGSDGDGDGGGPDPPSPPPQPPPTPLAVLIARAAARALLWRADELELTTAVDELEAEAEVSGLLAAIGQAEVAAIIADAFAAVCEPAVADGWTAAAAAYHAACGQRTLIVETAGEHLSLLRDLMAEDISLDHAVYELTAARAAAHAVATATLAAAEHLIRENDTARLRQWLDRHSAHERAAILQHLKQRKKVRPCQKRT